MAALHPQPHAASIKEPKRSALPLLKNVGIQILQLPHLHAKKDNVPMTLPQQLIRLVIISRQDAEPKESDVLIQVSLVQIMRETNLNVVHLREQMAQLLVGMLPVLHRQPLALSSNVLTTQSLHQMENAKVF